MAESELRYAEKVANATKAATGAGHKFYVITTKDNRKFKVKAESSDAAASYIHQKYGGDTTLTQDGTNEGNEKYVGLPTARSVGLKTDRDIAHDTFAKNSGLKQAAIGAGQSVNQLVEGVKGLFTDTDPQEQREMSMAEEGIHGAPAMAGGIAADLGMMAIPGMGLSKTLKALPRAKKGLDAALKLGSKIPGLGKLTTATGRQAVAGVGFESLKAPTENTSRLERATAAAAGAGLVAGGGKVLSRVVRGVKGSEAAKDLVKEFNLTKLTPGQWGQGNTRVGEKVMGGSMATWDETVRQQRIGLAEFNNALKKRIGARLGLNKADDFAGPEGFVKLGEQLDTSYNAIWDKSYTLNTKAYNRAVKELSAESSKRLSKKDALGVKALVAEADHTLKQYTEKGATGGRGVDDIMKKVQSQVDAAYNSETPNAIKGEVLKTFKAKLNKLLPAEEQAKLKELGVINLEFKAVKNASQKVEGGVFKPSALDAELRNLSQRQVVEGKIPLLKWTGKAKEVFESVHAADSPPGLESAMNLGGSIPAKALGFSSEGGRRLITGSAQRENTANILADVLRNAGVGPGRTGAAFGSELSDE